MLAIYLSIIICEFLNLKYEGLLGNIVHFIVALVSLIIAKLIIIVIISFIFLSISYADDLRVSTIKYITNKINR